MADTAYVDTSAFVKLVVREPESAALRRMLRRYPVRVASALTRAEALRAVRRSQPLAVPRVHEALDRLVVVAVTDDILVAAGGLEPPWLRTLDAVHLATALAVRARLGVLVTYDERMQDAATGLGLAVAAPA